MGFKSFLSRSSRRPLVNKSTGADVDIHNANAGLTNNIGGSHTNSNMNMNNASASKMGHKRNQSSRLVTGLQAMFNTHRRSKTAAPSSGPIILPMAASPAAPATASTPRKPSRVQTPKQEVSRSDAYRMTTPLIAKPTNELAPSPPSTADATAIESDATLLSSPQTYSTPPSSALTTSSAARCEESGPRIDHGPRVIQGPLEYPELVAAVPQMFSKTRVDDTPTASLKERVETNPPDPETSLPTAFEAGPAKTDTHMNEMEAALAGMRAAEKLLNERHAALHKPKANTSTRRKPNGHAIGKSGATAPLPAIIASHRRKQSRTANKAINGLQRRQAIKDMAFFAADGCPTNQDTMDVINAHLALLTRHPDDDIPDVTFDINGVTVLASKIPPGSVERNWIMRYNLVVHNATQVERRLMNIEDHEMILTQMFPSERGHILKPEHFEIFLTGLGEEGILTKSQAATIAKVQVITEEFDKGANFTGPSVDRHAHRRNPTSIALFDIPKQARRPMISYSPRPTNAANQHELYYKLRVLVEAAAYTQSFWKGYFFPSASDKLAQYYDAWKASQEGWLLPAYLTDYARDWTHKEVRLMQRGHLITDLLKKYEMGVLTDFGLIRAIRATYVNIPAQPFWCVEDLESFLYHRIPESGLQISMIADILVLHPDHDTATASPRLRKTVVDAIKERVKGFEKEEEARLKEIDLSYMTFEQQKKAEMSRWECVKAGWKSVFGKKEVLIPFDPFAPEHGVVEGGYEE